MVSVVKAGVDTDLATTRLWQACGYTIAALPAIVSSHGCTDFSVRAT